MTLPFVSENLSVHIGEFVLFVIRPIRTRAAFAFPRSPCVPPFECTIFVRLYVGGSFYSQQLLPDRTPSALCSKKSVGGFSRTISNNLLDCVIKRRLIQSQTKRSLIADFYVINYTSYIGWCGECIVCQPTRHLTRIQIAQRQRQCIIYENQ